MKKNKSIKKSSPITNCWLFLDCEVLTGKPQKKCPNRKACKENATNSPNRVCDLPYYYTRYSDNYNLRALVVCEDLPEEAISVGWQTAINLSRHYTYEDNCLTVGPCSIWDSFELPKSMEELGWAKPERLPFHFTKAWKDNKGNYHYYLEVITESSEAQKFGWHKAIKLQYHRFNYNLTQYGDEYLGKILKVTFLKRDKNYTEAINLGWFPPESLFADDD